MTYTLAGAVERRLPDWLENPRLGAREEAHWADFVADECTERGACSAALGGLSFSTIYHGFVWTLLCWSTAQPTLAFARPRIEYRLENLRHRTELFDRLATHYGDAYRGSAVFNYLLAFVAVLAALTTAPLAALTTTLHKASYVPASYVPGAVEVVILTFIALTYFRGRSQSEHAEPRGGSRWFCQRWHERWLDYRGLAECFRYAELRGALEPLPPPSEEAPGGLAERFRYADLRGALDRQSPIPPPTSEEAPSENWCTRYFRAQMAQTRSPRQSAMHYAEFLQAAVDEQQHYHHHNAHVCVILSERLHLWTIASFIAACLAAAVGFFLELEFATQSFTLESAKWFLYATAGLPAFAASLHGIHSACEWSKLARSSTDMEHALAEMRVGIEGLIASGCHENTEALNRFISRFIHLTTDEASGWRAALWDKNVPLGG